MIRYGWINLNVSKDMYTNGCVDIQDKTNLKQTIQKIRVAPIDEMMMETPKVVWAYDEKTSGCSSKTSGFVGGEFI